MHGLGEKVVHAGEALVGFDIGDGGFVLRFGILLAGSGERGPGDEAKEDEAELHPGGVGL